jgi:hypothetical protein
MHTTLGEDELTLTAACLQARITSFRGRALVLTGEWQGRQDPKSGRWCVLRSSLTDWLASRAQREATRPSSTLATA